MNARERNYYACGRRDGADMRAGAAAMIGLLKRELSRVLAVPEDEAARRTVSGYEQRLAALPALSRHPELAGLHGCVTAYDQGLADGAGVSLDEVRIRLNYLYMITDALRHRGAMPAAPEPGCTLVYFPHSDRGPLVANNNDGVAVHRHRQQPAWIVSNRAGIILGCVSSGVFDDEVSPESFPVPVYLLVSELCGTTSEAVDLMTRLNLFWGPCNALLADRAGNSAIIEKSSCRYGLRRSSDGFAATTEMSAEEPGFRAYLWRTRERSLAQRGLTRESADWAYWQAAAQRSTRLQGLLAAASEKPTFTGMEAIIYDHTGEPEQVHMDGSKCHPDQEDGEWSLRTTVWVIDELTAQSSFAEPPISSHLTERTWQRFDDFEPVF